MAKFDGLGIISKEFEKLGKYSYFYKVIQKEHTEFNAFSETGQNFYLSAYERTGQR